MIPRSGASLTTSPWRKNLQPSSGAGSIWCPGGRWSRARIRSAGKTSSDPPRWSMRLDATYLQDMRSAGREIQVFMGHADEAGFLVDPLLQAAVAYKLAIIGEAAGNLSPGFRAAHTAIPWQRIRGLRNHLIHTYGDVDQ